MMSKDGGVRRRRRRRTTAQWAELIALYSSSAVSQQAFCEAQGLSLSAFVRAVSKHRAAKGDAVVESPSAQFLPVALDAATSGHWELELQLGASVVVRVRGV